MDDPRPNVIIRHPRAPTAGSPEQAGLWRHAHEYLRDHAIPLAALLRAPWRCLYQITHQRPKAETTQSSDRTKTP